uniref:SH3 and multiple ankyrin repeat domains protein 3 n=1 Tax=Strigamia maritima TaxID=126957 RepID=T1J5G2_STRMM
MVKRGCRGPTMRPLRTYRRFVDKRAFLQLSVSDAAVAMEPCEADSVSVGSDEALVLIRVNVPELGVQKCLQFHRDELVWDVKQQVLAALPKELKESFNYGLFAPPQNGKAGKFLDEERPLSNYPLPGPIGYLELKYKRRIYKMMNVDEKQIKQLHTRANLRRMLEYVQSCQVEKVTKLCSKGLDPNFHCSETGETPLTIGATMKKSSKLLMALVNGGALLDYRTKDGCTAIHRAVEKNNHEAIKTLLDLGSSPNYRDNKGITPLYYTVLYNADPSICEMLLHDHAHIGAQDCQGWHEVHQACRNGMVQHLEHMLFYGADMNARNASGNTPLHVCAVNDQESCTRVLLFRGAEKEPLNYANQTPYQVAVIAGNLALAEIIQKHRPEDVVPYMFTVTFREAPKYNPRRRLSNASSILHRTLSDPRLETFGLRSVSSPSLSHRSMLPFSSASSLSETFTDTSTQPSLEDSDAGNTDTNSGMMCVCLEPYNSGLPDHLILSPGDIVEITAILESGLLEGRTKNQQGLFPSTCVQEVRLRNPDAKPVCTRVEGRREVSNRLQIQNIKNWKYCEEPRTVILHKGKKGYGFVLRGAKATSPLMEMQPSENCPALQYLDDVDKGGVADLAGLKKGDYLLAINSEDVTQASHEHVVNLIRKSGDLVAMTVVTVHPAGGMLGDKPASAAMRQCSTLPRKLMRGKAAPAPPRRDPRTTLSVGRARARSMVAGLAEIEALNQTLQQQYDAEIRGAHSSSIESLPYKPAAPTTDGQATVKTASIRARPASKRITAAELEEILARQGTPQDLTMGRPPGKLPKVYSSVAEMKRSRAGKQRGGGDATNLHKDFSSTPDLNAVEAEKDSGKRRIRSQENVAALNAKNNRHSWAFPSTTHSKFIDGRDSVLHAWGSDENLFEKCQLAETECANIQVSSTRGGPPPPPTHPPPPPPVSQVVRVDVSRARGEYANVTVDSKPMSSFRPIGEGSKMYASPEDAYIGQHKIVQSLRSCSLPAKLPPPPPGSSSSNTSSESETSGDSNAGAGFNSYKQVPYMVAPDAVSTDSGNSSERSHPSAKGNIALYRKQMQAEQEPFIPAPDYDVSEEEDDVVITPQNPPSIPPPPKVYEKQSSQESPSHSDNSQRSTGTIKAVEMSSPNTSPHKDAKKAIAEARDRLKSVQKPNDGHQTHLERRGSTGSGKFVTEIEVVPSDGDMNRQSFKPLSGKGTGDKPKKPPVPIPKQAKQSGGPTTLVKQDVASSPDFKHLIAQKVAERQRRMSQPEVEQQIGIVEDGEGGGSIVETSAVPKVRDQISVFEKKQEPGKPSASSPMRIPKRGENERTRTRSQVLDNKELGETSVPMKISKSCPTDLSQEELENSSSGVSSDVEGPAEVSGAAVEGGHCREELDSDDSDDLQDRGWLLRARLSEADTLLREEMDAGGRRVLTKNAVSLVKLPPPIESGETDGDSDVAELGPPTPVSGKSKKDFSAGMAAATTVLRPGARQVEKPTQMVVVNPMPSKPVDIVPAPIPPVMKMTHATTNRSGRMQSLPMEIKSSRGGPAASSPRGGDLEMKQSPPVVVAKHKTPPSGPGSTVIEVKQGPPTAARSRSTDSQRITYVQDGRDQRQSSALSRHLKEQEAMKGVSQMNVQYRGQGVRQVEDNKSSPPMSSKGAYKSGSHQPPQTSRKKKHSDGPNAAELERSIEQSLELIKMHVDSLHEVNVLAGLVPPPPEFEGATTAEQAGEVGMIAPPPEFSDDVHVPLAHQLQELLLVGSLPRHSSTQSLQQAMTPGGAGTLRNTKQALKMGYATISGASSSAASATSRLVRPKTLTTDVGPPMTKSKGQKMSPEMAKTPPGGGGMYNGSVESPVVRHDGSGGGPKGLSINPKDFGAKPLQQWTSRDVSDWLESLFMPEYKGSFEAAGINGSRLATIDNSALLELGVKRVGHRLNMERSLRRHMSQK